MKVCIVGTGYVGLVTGACLAESGNYVKCVDTDRRKCEALNSGEIPIYEPGLETMVHRNSSHGRLSFSTDIDEGASEADFIFIAVGTPPSPDGSADLSYVERVAHQIGQTIDKYVIVVTKSTVPVGTTESVERIIKEELERRDMSSLHFDVAFCPEFLREGSAIDDFMHPDRVVLGTKSNKARESLVRLFSPLTGGENGIYCMNIASAELTKYAANSMLATRISFMNELAGFCRSAGADIDDIRRGIGSDHRIGPSFLNAGIGYGGSCFPKDVKALIRSAKKDGKDMSILRAVEEVNRKQKTLPVSWATEHFGQNLSGLTFVLWGLSFKPETDDMREAPAVEIVRELNRRGATIRAFDPVAAERAREIMGSSIKYFEDYYEPLKNADCLIIVTEWTSFREPDFKKIKDLMKTNVIFDGRNIYDPEKMKELGFEYRSVGR